MTASASDKDKQKLKKRIDSIDNKRLIDALHKMIETHQALSTENNNTDELIHRATISEQEIQTGKVIELSTVMKRFRK